MFDHYGSIHFLHGFLGAPSDWDGLKWRWGDPVHYDLFSPRREGRIIGGLNDHGKWVNSNAYINGRIDLEPYPRILVGYSLGGRIALHSLIQDPSLWTAAVIISGHPGLRNSDERTLRVQDDEKWSSRFLKGNWNNLIQDWNEKSVFQNGDQHVLHPSREERDFSRSQLSQVMKSCSLGFQDDLREDLKKLNVPILWVTGENDEKFCKIADEVVGLNPKIYDFRVPNSGHRIPWDQPERLRTEMEAFIDGAIGSRERENLNV